MLMILFHSLISSANLRRNPILLSVFHEKGTFSDMGSCASAHKSKDSAMKTPSNMQPKSQNLSVSSPTNEKLASSQHPIAQFGSHGQKSDLHASRDFGSKEDAYFDSQAWLESDCEDDFLSINGDFTSSCGGTPKHERSISGTPQLSEASSMDGRPIFKPETFGIDQKIKLSELLNDSPEREQPASSQNTGGPLTNKNGNPGSDMAHAAVPLKSSEVTLNSILSSERTQSKDSNHEKRKPAKKPQCCLPSLVPNLSFNERKRQPSTGE